MPSYEKSKASGLWSVRFREMSPIDGTTKNKRLSGYKTKREAQYGYEDYIKDRDERIKKERELAELAKSRPDDILFDVLLEDYMRFEKSRIKESTYYDMESKVRNRVIPYFKGKRMSDITPKMITDWITEIPYSYKSKTWIFSWLSSFYKYGNKYYDITETIKKADRPRNTEPPKEMEVWTPKEFQTFLAAVKGDIYHAFFLTLYCTGMRRGEALALSWEDIDGDEIKVRKSYTTKTKEAAYKITTTKTGSSVRRIPLPAILKTELEALEESQRKQYGESFKRSLFIFGGEDPASPNAISYAFDRAIEAAGVKRIRVHDLRHSCASVLLSHGVSIVAVSRQLGHRDTTETLKTYTHMMPDDKTLIKNTLDALGTELGTIK